MKKMNAVVAYGAGDYRYEEVEYPEAGIDEIIIKIEAAGICASDRAVYLGQDPWGGIISPKIPGHEFVGTITKLGEEEARQRNFREGDRVTAECILPCGECYYCRKGLYHLCEDPDNFLEGGFAQYMKLPKRARIHKVPLSLAPEEAAIIEPLSCSAYAVEQASIGMRDTVVISGLGTIGMGMLQLAKLKNPYRLIGVDLDDGLCGIASELGADLVLNPARDDVEARIREVTDGVGCDIYMEASGNPISVKTGLQSLRKQGLLFIYSVFKNEASIDFNLISEFKELTVKGGHLSPNMFPVVIKLLEEGKINARVMATDILPMEEVDRAMKAKACSAENRRPSIKTILIP